MWLRYLQGNKGAEMINMNTSIGVGIAVAVLSSLFLLLGNRFFWIFRRQESLLVEWLLGFALFLGVFSLIDVPIELSEQPFHVLVYAEEAVFAVLALIGIVWYAKKNAGSIRTRLKRPDILVILFAAIVIAQMIYGMNNRIYASYYDTSYYNGNAINAIYTDTIYRYDPYTGVYVGDATEHNDSYPMLIAVLAKSFGMHPLVIVNRVLGILELAAVNFIIYEIALQLSNKNRKIAVWTVGLHAVMSLLCGELSLGNEYALWLRMAESKSMLANVYLPLVLLGLIGIAKQAKDKANWIILMIVVFAGISMSLSGIFIILLMAAVGLFSVLLGQHRGKYWGYALLCILPGVLMGAIRFLG
jgi:hypothetical protein